MYDLRKIQLPWRDDEPDEVMRLQDIYNMAVERATSAVHAISTIALVIAIIAAVCGVGAVALVVWLALRYRRHHRIPGVLVSYDSLGDWARVRLPDGMEIKVHCPIASLEEGTEVLVAITRGGAYVIDPPIRRGKPVELPPLVSVEEL